MPDPTDRPTPASHDVASVSAPTGAPVAINNTANVCHSTVGSIAIGPGARSEGTINISEAPALQHIVANTVVIQGPLVHVPAPPNRLGILKKAFSVLLISLPALAWIL